MFPIQYWLLQYLIHGSYVEQGKKQKNIAHRKICYHHKTYVQTWELQKLLDLTFGYNILVNVIIDQETLMRNHS